jgi:UDP-N-acetylglucosamine 2-epimerase
MLNAHSSDGPWLLCMGTRPEIIKMAPVYRAFRAAGDPVRVLHADQGDPLAWPTYRFFAMRPDCEVMLEHFRAELAPQTSELLARFGEVIDHVRPCGVLVHGDSINALAAASAAHFARVPVGHVGAGLRSHSPEFFPTGKNRELIARLASVHFAPTGQARENLLREGIADDTIFVTGSTVGGAVQLALDRLRVTRGELVDVAVRDFLSSHTGHRLVLVTAHGRDHGALHRIAAAVARILRERPDVAIVWPLHADPAMANEVSTGLDALDPLASARLLLTGSLDYPSLISVLRRCWLSMTDSGTVQEEAVSLGVPVLVLAAATERQEILATGFGRLVGTETGSIVAGFDALADDGKAYAAMRCPSGSSPFGDGHAAERICSALLETA